MQATIIVLYILGFCSGIFITGWINEDLDKPTPWFSSIFWPLVVIFVTAYVALVMIHRAGVRARLKFQDRKISQQKQYAQYA